MFGQRRREVRQRIADRIAGDQDFLLWKIKHGIAGCVTGDAHEPELSSAMAKDQLVGVSQRGKNASGLRLLGDEVADALDLEFQLVLLRRGERSAQIIATEFNCST